MGPFCRRVPKWGENRMDEYCVNGVDQAITRMQRQTKGGEHARHGGTIK